MKKVLSILLVLTLLMGVSSGFVFAAEVLPDVQDFEAEFMAAPAVAGLLLKAAGVDNRYGQGKNGGNFIKDIAQHMGPGTDFDGVAKEDVVGYNCAIAAFLNSIGANVTCPYDGIVDPATSEASFSDNTNRTGTMYLTVMDMCGHGITGLSMADIDVDITSVGLSNVEALDIGGYWDISLIDYGDGTYELLFNRTGSFPYGPRLWDVLVQGVLIEDEMTVTITDPMDPVASEAYFIDNTNRTGTMYLTVKYLSGNGITGLSLADIDLDIQWLGLANVAALDSGGYWDINLTDNGDGTYELLFNRTGSVPYGLRDWDVLVQGVLIEDDMAVTITNPLEVYTLSITSINNNTGYTHSFTINYYPGTNTVSGTGVGEVISDIVFDGYNLSFKSVHLVAPVGYIWYPAFTLESDGTLAFVDLSGDNVWAATGTWTVQ